MAAQQRQAERLAETVSPPTKPAAATDNTVSAALIAANVASAQAVLTGDDHLPLVRKQQKHQRVLQAGQPSGQLPVMMIGAAQLSVADLTELVRTCGLDADCWLRSLRNREREEALAGQVAAELAAVRASEAAAAAAPVTSGAVGPAFAAVTE